MPVLFTLLLTLPSLGFLFCVVRFWTRRREPGRFARTSAALGWIATCSLPALLWQVSSGPLSGGGPGLRLRDLPHVLGIGWWVLTGGGTVAAVFERTAKAVSGHRQMTMIDNWPWFWTLLAGQLALLVALLVPRLGPRFRWRDARLWGVGLIVAINAGLAVRWPWWGS